MARLDDVKTALRQCMERLRFRLWLFMLEAISLVQMCLFTLCLLISSIEPVHTLIGILTSAGLVIGLLARKAAKATLVLLASALVQIGLFFLDKGFGLMSAFDLW